MCQEMMRKLKEAKEQLESEKSNLMYAIEVGWCGVVDQFINLELSS